MIGRFTTAAAAAAMLCACGQGATNKANTASAANSSATAPANVAAPSTNSAATAQSGSIQLAPDGLTLPGGARLAFGTAPAEAVQRLQAVLGAPTERLPETDDCSRGMRERVSWNGGLTTFFTADGFVGWAADGDGLRTAAGLGPSVARTQVQAAGARIEEGNEAVPPKFQIDGLTGTMGINDGLIKDMWAGRTCAPEGGS